MAFLIRSIRLRPLIAAERVVGARQPEMVVALIFYCGDLNSLFDGPCVAFDLSLTCPRAEVPVQAIWRLRSDLLLQLLRLFKLLNRLVALHQDGLYCQPDRIRGRLVVKVRGCRAALYLQPFIVVEGDGN